VKNIIKLLALTAVILTSAAAYGVTYQECRCQNGADKGLGKCCTDVSCPNGFNGTLVGNTVAACCVAAPTKTPCPSTCSPGVRNGNYYKEDPGGCCMCTTTNFSPDGATYVYRCENTTANAVWSPKNCTCFCCALNGSQGSAYLDGNGNPMCSNGGAAQGCQPT